MLNKSKQSLLILLDIKFFTWGNKTVGTSSSRPVLLLIAITAERVHIYESHTIIGSLG